MAKESPVHKCFINGKHVVIGPLARVLKMDRTDLGRVFRGSCAISYAKAKKIAYFLDITVEQLASECGLVESKVIIGDVISKHRLVPADPSKDHGKRFQGRTSLMPTNKNVIKALKDAKLTQTGTIRHSRVAPIHEQGF